MTIIFDCKSELNIQIKNSLINQENKNVFTRRKSNHVVNMNL